MDRHIPLIISESTPFERGLHLGRSAQSRVIHTVTAYMEIFQRISAQDRYVREYSETRERDKRHARRSRHISLCHLRAQPGSMVI